MNKLWDDLKDNMKEWGASAVEKAEEISRVAVAKGEEFTKISKIKIEILQLQKKKSKQYEKLGKLVYRHAQDDNMANFTGNAEFFEIISKINTISKDILVDEYSFYIPNTFIPTSSESENKIFKGYGIGVEEYELKIFSRWGELIFKSNDLDVGWDGTYQFGLNNSTNNDLCSVGVYTYTVFIENIYGEVFEYQGKVKLLR